MPTVQLWKVGTDAAPVAVRTATEWLEKHLENWIGADPSLVESGLLWLGRQWVVPDGGRLDLFGITRQGEWVVTELKAGPVNVFTLTQALTYAVALAGLSADDLRSKIIRQTDEESALIDDALRRWSDGHKPLRLLLIGTQITDAVEPAIEYLRQNGLTLRVSTALFQVFEWPDGSHVLARALEDLPEVTPALSSSRGAPSLESLREQAQTEGTEHVFDAFHALARDEGFRIRTWGRSFTFMSPLNGTRTYFYVGLSRPEEVMLGISAENIGADHALDRESVLASMGAQEWPKGFKRMSSHEALQYVDRWRSYIRQHMLSKEPRSGPS